MGKVFLAADGSAHSKRALEKAIQLAKAANASIDIVHVISARESKEAALHSTGKIDLETKRKQMLKPLFDLAEAEGVEYEYIELRGEPERTRCDGQARGEQRGRLPPAECVQLGLNLTLALGHLHRHGLIHRDIKPANIIFVGGIPKLADIGLVTSFADACSFVGTEGFIAPEGP